jgi:hypothetical protein
METIKKITLGLLDGLMFLSIIFCVAAPIYYMVTISEWHIFMFLVSWIPFAIFYGIKEYMK